MDPNLSESTSGNSASTVEAFFGEVETLVGGTVTIDGGRRLNSISISFIIFPREKLGFHPAREPCPMIRISLSTQ